MQTFFLKKNKNKKKNEWVTRFVRHAEHFSLSPLKQMPDQNTYKSDQNVWMAAVTVSNMAYLDMHMRGRLVFP